jgi:1,4-dihydroxy-2-naphthoate octaprenyltransferase
MTTRALAAPLATPRRRSQIAAGVWRVADPKITLASVASMLIGAAAAAHDGPIAWPWLALTVVGIFAVEAAKNASGEIVDWDSGADQGLAADERTPFSGGKRVLVDGLMTRTQTAIVAAVFYAIAIAVGFAIAYYRELGVLALGVAGLSLAFFYHAPPLRLSYRGLGEIAVALCYGPLIAAGTYLVQRHTIGADVLLVSVPLGIAIAAFLWVNELPDARADAAAGKRTLVVRLGRHRAADVMAWLVVGAYVALALTPLAGAPWPVLLGGIGLPVALRAMRRVVRFPDVPARLVPAQAGTLLAFVLMSVGVAAGFVVDTLL